MPFKFNPFSGNFDQTGSGGGSTVFDGEVQFFSDLPQTVGTPPVNSAYLVRESEGTIWFGNKKQKGIYIRSGNSGVRNDDWTYGGEYPVTSVNGATGAVTVAAEQHASEHEAGEADEIQAMAALVDTDYLPLNGVYFHDGTLTSGKRNFFKTGTRKNTKIVYNSGSGQWNLVRNNVVEAVGVDGPDTVPWGNTWEDFVTPEFVNVTRLGLEDMVQKVAETGAPATATTSEDGLMSSSDKTKLNGIAAGAEVNVNADWNATSGDAQILNKPSTFAPSAHSGSHAATGSDPLYDQDLDTTDSPTFAGLTVDEFGVLTVGANGAVDFTAAQNVDFGPINTSVAIKDTASQNTGTFRVEADSLAANRTYDLPDRSGELMIVGDAPSSHTHGNLTNDGKVGSDSGRVLVTTTAGAVTTLALGTAGQVLTVNSGATGVEFAAASGGVGGGSGSVDNAIIRAQGTGGSEVQSSDINILDATTSTQNNVAITNEHSGQTNSALVLTPKGTGAFIVGPRPDGTSTGGNARGAQAVDLQYVRNTATQVASGEQSAVLGGERNTASGTESCVAGGFANVASGSWAFACGNENTSSGTSVFVMGSSNTASGSQSSVIAGRNALADRSFIAAMASGRFAVGGDAQRIWACLRNKTTTNSAVELLMGFSADTRLTIPSGKVMAMLINITGAKSDGSAVAHYVRQYALKNVSGTTSEVYAPVTIGTDNAAGTTIALSANDTNDALRINVTGIASETWRWVANVDAVEVAYGT